MTNSTRNFVPAAGLALAVIVTGCDGRPPLAPSPPIVTNVPVVPSGPPPTITAVSPATGSTGGDSTLKISGTGFQRESTVTLDGTRMTGHFGPQTLDVIYVTTPSHAAGTVNLAVTNPDGKSTVMADAFTYASPASFDFNGTWSGYVSDGSDEEVRITIQNNMVTGVSCKGWERTFSPSPAIENGEFSFLGADGEAIFGRIVSASEAVGTIKIASCAAPWRAGKLSR